MITISKADLVELIRCKFSADAALICERSSDISGDLKELEAEMREYAAERFGSEIARLLDSATSTAASAEVFGCEPWGEG